MKLEKPTQQDYDNWIKDPSNWIWGMFYYNKKDDRILPPKRQEWMGFTTNFANRKSIAALFILLAFAGFVISFIYFKKH